MEDEASIPSKENPGATHPFHIWLIAGSYGMTSILVVWSMWATPNLAFSRNLSESLIILSLSLVPGVLGVLLVCGMRWVRWLFLALIPLVGATALLASFGNAMRTVPQEAPEATYLGCFFFVNLLSTIAVFGYFARQPEA